MSFLEVTQGDSPLVLGFPHTGTDLPADVADRLNENGRLLRDTDWHVHRLYADLLPNTTTIRTKIHRYVIDVNRDPSGQSLYPGQSTTDLVPLTDFDGDPIWRVGREPDAAEIARRLRDYHAPYHAALKAELDRIRTRHGFAILYDCHSIRSRVPFLFDGRLPDLNIGTNNGATCSPDITAYVQEICLKSVDYSHVLNGRFKGGWTTRAYGKPRDGFHAIQMELAQSAYLDAEQAPWHYDTEKSEKLREILAQILLRINQWRPG